ncbi:MAG TPA: hypothetical protein VM842_01805 [Nitrospira sp.]|nr:hypothetical protein [Nitrospira sp.]
MSTLFGISLFATLWAEAAENRPFWTEQALFHFGDDVFFTGRASCAPNVEQGRQRAYMAAVQEVKNFTRVQEVGGFPLDTQMVFEDPHPPDCASGLVTVWRLLRAPRTSLESLANHTAPGRRKDVSPILAQTMAIRNLTPRLGMSRDEVWNRYGLPRSIWAHPEKGELTWEYAQFGLSIVFNHDDVLTRWRLNGQPSPSSHDVPSPPQEDSMDGKELPAIDLTARLQQLEHQQDLDRRHQAQRYCMLRFAEAPLSLRPKQDSCEQREYERLKEQRRPF